MCNKDLIDSSEMTMGNIEELLLANKADEETQNARLAKLKGKRVLWLTAPCIPGMSKGMKDSARWVIEQEVVLYACFESPEDKLYEIMKSEGLFSHAVFADLSTENAHENIVKSLSDSDIIVEAIFSPYEMIQTLVGQVAELLDLPGNSSNSYKIARSKHEARLATAKAGLATPLSGQAQSLEQLEIVLEKVGFPCIIKPSSGAGSCGVLRANDMEEGRKAYKVIQDDIAKNSMLAYNPGCEPGVIVEQFLVGDEFDVDMLLWNGELMYHQCVYNWPTMAPYFLETGTQMPAPFPEESQRQLAEYSFNCVKAMGFDKGCFHVEVMLTANGPVLIEVNARQGGGPNQVFNLEMCDVNMFANFFMAICGIPINPPRKEEITFAMADYAITCPFTGVLVNDDHMQHIRSHPNVVSTQDFVKPGGKVHGLDCGFPEWVSQFIVKGDSPDHCKEIIESLIKDIETRITVIPAPAEPQQKGVEETPEEVVPQANDEIHEHSQA